MRRRQFITLLGGAFVAWPLAARAQQPAMPIVGFLHSGSPDSYAPHVTAFRQGLSESGYVEGRNVAIEFRWAGGQNDRLPALAADLVRQRVAVIAATGGNVSALAAKAATATIPIVFSGGADPIKTGLVASINRPGGNVTGVNVLTAAMETKRLGLLRELVPTSALMAVLVNPTNPNVETQSIDIKEAARAVDQQVIILQASTERGLDTAFVRLAELRTGALLVGADPFFFHRRNHIVALAARHATPAIYEQREFAVAGGLASYGTNLADGYRQVGIYTGRVLRGENPAELPIMQSTRFEFVLNLKTAKTLGLTIPNAMQLLADEVIE